MILESHSECEKCGGTGWIDYEKDGYEYGRPCECRAAKIIELQLKASGIEYAEYAEKTLETFKADTEMAAKMKRMAEEYLADRPANGIGYFGKSGTGKTHICIAICQELTRRGEGAHKYFSYRTEIQRLKALAYNEPEYFRQMDGWTSCDILYIDDLFKFAKDRQGNIYSQDLQITYDIINTRYLNRSRTIFSSEYTVNDIKNIDSALGSRIYEMIRPYGLECTGKNRRYAK